MKTYNKLIPRQVLFGNPDKAMVKVSHDGKHLAFLAPFNNVLNIWVAPKGEIDRAKPVTKEKNRAIAAYYWSYTNQHLIYLNDKNGDENWHVFSVEIETGEEKDLTPYDNVAARPERISHKHPGEIVISINHRNPEFHDPHKVNIITGKSEMIIENNEGFGSFHFDHDYHLHFGTKMTPEGGEEIMKLNQENTWEPFMDISPEDSLTTGIAHVLEGGSAVYMLSSKGRDKAALTEMTVETKEETVIAESDKADINEVFLHPETDEVLAAGSKYMKKEWIPLDDGFKEDLEHLQSLTDGEVSIVSKTFDNRLWVVAFQLDNSPVKYYLYDRETKDPEFLFTNKKDLEEYTLSKMHPVKIKSRDGLDLISYCTLPVEKDQQGTPPHPLPMVLLVHGGPWHRDDWGYHPYHQLLANRGYAVLSVNFRGSTGFGKSFINAGNREWSKKMHDDLIDAVDWAIDKGIADPEKVAIMGGSYGGYATLVGLTFTPEKFACGVDIVGPSNIVTLLKSIPPYWKPMLNVFTLRVGDISTEEGRAFLKECSPLTYVDKISKPLLIGQGANDPRVKQAESDQIVSAMKEKNIPVTYVLYPDEGHGFRRPENNISFTAVLEAFLAKCLGGRYEETGNDLEGASMEIPEGKEYVLGV